MAHRLADTLLTMKPDDALLIWSGPVPAGARVMSEPPALDGVSLWVDVCIMGQHLPQVYRMSEVVPLDAAKAKAHGLCPDCLGYGTPDPGPVSLAAGIDQVEHPCVTCEGSGRPAMRVHVSRTPNGVQAGMFILDHEAVLMNGACLACGMDLHERSARHV